MMQQVIESGAKRQRIYSTTTAICWNFFREAFMQNAGALNGILSMLNIDFSLCNFKTDLQRPD